MKIYFNEHLINLTLAKLMQNVIQHAYNTIEIENAKQEH